MRVGINYLSPSLSTDPADTDRKYRDFFEQVEWANDKGFTGIWLTEHHFSGYSLSSSPLVLLAKAATLAPDLRVGTGILVLPLWDPVRLVAEVATLDVLTSGRVDLGVGRGYQPHEFHGFGRDLAGSRPVFEESVGLIRRLFTEWDLTHSGSAYHIDAPVTVLPRAVQEPHPPIWLAAVSPESTRFAVEQGFNFMGLALSTPDELAKQRRLVEEIAAETGHSVDGREHLVNRFVYVSEDPGARAQAAREVARQMALSRALAQGVVPVRGIVPGADVVDPADEALAYERLLGGTPDEVVAQLETLQDAGVTYVNAAFSYGALPAEVAFSSLRLFASHVLPALGSVRHLARH